MDTAALFLVLAIAGVNFGWQPAENSSDGYEYIVQVEPELLDVLQRGDAMPIESNIPADVAPIRKIRIVVGRGELPRSHMRHMAHFADPPAWPPRYPAAPAGNTNDNRYAAPASPAATGVGPPPNVLERAATAVDETTRALSEGVQAAAESAGDQFSRAGNQLMNGAANTTQGMGQQLQQWTTDATRQVQETGNNLRTATSETIGAANNQLRQAENPFGSTAASSAATSGSGVSEPPWPYGTSNTSPPSWSADAAAAQNSPASNAATPATSTPRPAIGWTGIAPNVAAPPLLNQSPPAVTTPNAGPNPRIAGNNARGPTFPAGATTAQEPLHSRLIDPASQSAAGATANDPARGWGSNGTTTQPTISRGNGLATGGVQNTTGMISEPPPTVPTAQNTQRAADRWDDLWRTETQGSLPSTPPPKDSGSFADSGQPANGSTTPPATTSSATNLNTTGFPPSHISHAGTAAGFQQSPNNQATQVPTAEQPPWLPLLIVSLSLVGSLSANLFLGWSYMDARQKYRALVRKTADTFRRVAGAAAA